MERMNYEEVDRLKCFDVALELCKWMEGKVDGNEVVVVLAQATALWFKVCAPGSVIEHNAEEFKKDILKQFADIVPR
jgi:hypothetical protein